LNYAFKHRRCDILSNPRNKFTLLIFKHKKRATSRTE
jgi:hypothetical protein